MAQYLLDQGSGSSFTQPPLAAMMVPSPMASGSVTITTERVTSKSASGEESSYEKADLKVKQ